MTPPSANGNWPSSAVQSLLFERDRYSESQAKRWAQDHGYKYGAVDTTDHYHRLRQFAPDGRPCRTIEFGHGINAIVCATDNPPRGKFGPEILLVEDDPKIQAATVRTLKKTYTDPHVIIADNVGAAIADLECHEFMLIVSDVHLVGHRTGIDLFHHVQEHYPHMVDRFVFFTDDEEAREIHDRYIQKGAATAEDFRRATRGRPAGAQSRTPAPAAPPPPQASMTLEEFAEIVNRTAASIPENYQGGLFHDRIGDKVFISAIWRVLEFDPRFRGVTLSQFKSLLIKANHQMSVSLARADLVDVMDPDDVTTSEITHLGGTFHLVTVRAPSRSAGSTRATPRPAPPALRADLDVATFAHGVLAVLPSIQTTNGPDGRPIGRWGRDKVFIAAVKRSLQRDPRFAALSSADWRRLFFHAMRDSHLILARADAVGAMDPAEVAASEISDRGADLHFVIDPDAPDYDGRPMRPNPLPNPRKPDLRRFAQIVVLELPYIVAEEGPTGGARGRFGPRKVFISALWRTLTTHPDIRGISLQEFKARLYEASRARLVELARADLVAAMDPEEVAQSEFAPEGGNYPMFHFVVDED